MRISLRPPPRGPALRRRPECLPEDHPLPLLYRRERDEAPQPAAEGELVRDERLALVEAALLAADEPLTARKLAMAAGLADAAEARRQVKRLHALYASDGTAFQVEELAGGFQLLTRPEYHRWLVRLRRGGQELRLTAAMKETLAIVAYRQPIMRADVEAIRGVHCGEVLRMLMEKGLLRITGRHDSLGRPVLYGTTRKFLQVYGLKSLKDLPQVEELQAPRERAAEENAPKTDELS